MKVLLIVFSLFLLVSPASALVVTDSVHKTNFHYEIGYDVATGDLAASQSAVEIPIFPKSASGGNLNHSFYYVVPRDGNIVGMSVAGNAACTLGAATFDVTINGKVTGIQTIIEPNSVGADSTARQAVGNSGAAGAQWAYIRQDRAETAVSQGFRKESDFSDRHATNTTEQLYGKATALVAGNRVGVKVTTNSTFVPIYTDYVVTIYVLH